MKFYNIAVIAILALTLGPQVEAGLLDGVLGVVGNLANDVLQTVGHIVLGGPNMQPQAKIVTLMTKDGKIIGHMKGDFVRVAELVVRKNGEIIRVRAANNNSEVQILNMSGSIVFKLSGPKAKPLINLLLRYNGEILSTLNRLGNVHNGVQDVLDNKGNVIDTLAPSAVADNGGVVLLAGKPLLGLIGTVSDLATGLQAAANGLLGKDQEGLNVDGDLDLIESAANTASSIVPVVNFPKIVVCKDKDGKIVGYIKGDLIGLVGKFTGGVLGEPITLKVTNNNSGISVTNKNGEPIVSFSGPSAAGLIKLVQHYGGEMRLCLVRLGNVENGEQLLLDGADKVIDKISASSIHSLGVLTIIGNDLWNAVSSNTVYLDGLLQLTANLYDEVLKDVDSADGLVNNVVGNAVDTAGNLLGSLADAADNIVPGGINTILDNLGGLRFPVNGKLVTFRGPTGAVIISLSSGDLVSFFEKLIAQPGESLSIKLDDAKTGVQVVDKAGKILAALTGAEAQPFVQVINQLGGPISVCLSTLGPVENGVQIILDSANNVIDKFTQSDVHNVAGIGTYVGNKFWMVVQLVAGIEKLKMQLLGLAINEVINIGASGVNLATNIINNILGGQSPIDQLTNREFLTLIDASNKIRAHLYGNTITPLLLLTKLHGGALSLVPSKVDNGKVLLVNQANKIVSILSGAFVPKVKELIQQCGGRLSLMINTLHKTVDKIGNTVIAFVDGNSQVVDVEPLNALHAINIPVGNVVDKILVVGNGLKNLDDCIVSLANAMAQATAYANNPSATLQLGNPLITVKNSEGKVLSLLMGGKFVTVLQNLFQQYGSNIHLTLDKAVSGVVNVINDKGTVIQQINDKADLVKLIQECGGKITLNLNKLDVVTNNNGEKVVVAKDNNGNIVAVVSGNPLKPIVNPVAEDQTIVAGNPIVGSVIIDGLAGCFPSGTTSGQTGGAGSETTGGTNGQTSGTGSVSTGTGGLLGGGLTGILGGLTGSGSNTGLLGGLTNTVGGVLGGLTNTVDGLLGGVTGSNGGLLGGITGTNGGLLGGLTNTVGGLLGGVTGNNGDLLGGLTNTVGGLLGGVTGSNGGLTNTVGGLLGGSTGSNGGLLGGITGTNGGLLGGLTNTVGGLLGGVTGNNGGLLSGVTGANGDLLGGITNTVGGVLGGITGANGGLLGGLTGTDGGLLGGVTGSNGGLLGGLTNTIGGVLGGATGSSGGLLNSLTGSSGGFLGGLLGGVTGGSTSVSGGASVSTSATRPGLLGIFG